MVSNNGYKDDMASLNQHIWMCNGQSTNFSRDFYKWKIILFVNIRWFCFMIEYSML